jgi:hypothetical protein
LAIHRQKRDNNILTTYSQADNDVWEMGEEGLMGEGATGETAARLMASFAHDNLSSDTTYSHIPWCEHEEDTDISRFCIADQDHEALVVTVESVEDHYERQRMWREYLRDTPRLADPHVVRQLRDERDRLQIAGRQILDIVQTNIDTVSEGVNYDYKRKQQLTQFKDTLIELFTDLGLGSYVTRRQRR